MANIVYLVDSYFGSAWYRGHVPGLALKDRGHDVIMTDEPTDNVLEPADVVVLLHLAYPGVLEMVERLNAHGKTTVFETDDDYWALHPDNPASKYWNADRQLMLAKIAAACTVATVSTPFLAGVMRPINPEVRVLPNMLPDVHWPTTRKPTNRDDQLVLGWAGSSSHAADMRMILPVMTQMLEEYPRLRVQLVGASEDWIRPHSRVELVPWVEIEEYASVLSDLDIGVAPVQDTRFNRCKSDLKFVEYGMIGIPVVASQVEAYTSSIIPGENGFMARNAKDWIKHLRRLIEDVELREKLGANARAFAESRLISRNVELWERAYGLTD